MFDRRKLIKSLIAISSTLVLLPQTIWAAWPKQAFQAEQLDNALFELYGEQLPELSKQIKIKLNKRVESGDSVAVNIATSLDEVESISLFVSKNTPPLTANFNFSNQAIPYIATRIKLSQNCEVIAVVKTKTGLFRQQKSIKVLSGSCI